VRFPVGPTRRRAQKLCSTALLQHRCSKPAPPLREPGASCSWRALEVDHTAHDGHATAGSRTHLRVTGESERSPYELKRKCSPHTNKQSSPNAFRRMRQRGMLSFHQIDFRRDRSRCEHTALDGPSPVGWLRQAWLLSLTATHTLPPSKQASRRPLFPEPSDGHMQTQGAHRDDNNEAQAQEGRPRHKRCDPANCFASCAKDTRVRHEKHAGDCGRC